MARGHQFWVVLCWMKAGRHRPPWVTGVSGAAHLLPPAVGQEWVGLLGFCYGWDSVKKFFKFWGHSLLLFTFLSPLWLSTELLTVCIVVLGGEEQGELSHLIPNKKLMWIFKEECYTANTKAILNVTEFLIMYLIMYLLLQDFTWFRVIIMKIF